jgi:hypothetical protein
MLGQKKILTTNAIVDEVFASFEAKDLTCSMTSHTRPLPPNVHLYVGESSLESNFLAYAQCNTC